jgi:glycine cleavage system H lipoate-binding protein
MKKRGRPNTGTTKFPTSITLTREMQEWLRKRGQNMGGVSISQQVQQMLMALYTKEGGRKERA